MTKKRATKKRAAKKAGVVQTVVESVGDNLITLSSTTTTSNKRDATSPAWGGLRLTVAALIMGWLVDAGMDKTTAAGVYTWAEPVMLAVVLGITEYARKRWADAVAT